ncbi:hypothetical protein JXB22_09535, partial [candidate division WOR-3 bacterium]|nr:hypothetical protein [candidate division WOR-3 bacterium]
MKKIYMLILCLALVPMLYAANNDATNTPSVFSPSNMRVMTMEEFQQNGPLPLQAESIYVCQLTQY